MNELDGEKSNSGLGSMGPKLRDDLVIASCDF